MLSNRAAKAASVAPITGEDAVSMRQATLRALQDAKRAAKVNRKQVIADWLDASCDAIMRYRNDGEWWLSDDETAMLSISLMDMRVRDDAWARMLPEYGTAHIRLWTDLTRRAQSEFVAPAASLLAFVAWQQNDIALANAALDRALAAAPRYSMAELLRAALDSGAPSSMARLPMSPEEVAASYDEEEKEGG